MNKAIMLPLGNQKKVFSMIRKHFLVVGILGLEPRMTGPESVVLPLHHIPKSNTVVADSTNFVE